MGGGAELLPGEGSHRTYSPFSYTCVNACSSATSNCFSNCPLVWNCYSYDSIMVGPATFLLISWMDRQSVLLFYCGTWHGCATVMVRVGPGMVVPLLWLEWDLAWLCHCYG